eukprot:4084276-Amphidinium_carterae.2
MLAVRQRLKHRACADAIGWTQCVMSQVLGREQMVPVITAHLRRYSMGLMATHSSNPPLQERQGEHTPHRGGQCVAQAARVPCVACLG